MSDLTRPPSNPSPPPPGWLRLARPIQARLDGRPVVILDIAPDHLLVEHLGNIHSRSLSIEFEWRNRSIRLEAFLHRVVEQFWDGDAKGTISESELRLGGERELLEQAIADYQAEITRAEAANLEGEFRENRIDGETRLDELGSARRLHTHGYLRCRLLADGWVTEITSDSSQPPDGFTISLAEPEEQVRLLQLAYEESNDEARAMLREFSALSLQQ